MEISYNELKTLEVVNIKTGASLGRISDLVLDAEDGQAVAIIVPGRRGFRLFGKSADLYIDWNKITTIGSDVILVNLKTGDEGKRNHRHKQGGQIPCPPEYNCPPPCPPPCPPKNNCNPPYMKGDDFSSPDLYDY